MRLWLDRLRSSYWAHRFMCSCGSWVCRLDSALHAVHLTVRPVCDRHERLITKGF
jgi:hypothetical protein